MGLSWGSCWVCREGSVGFAMRVLLVLSWCKGGSIRVVGFVIRVIL